MAVTRGPSLIELHEHMVLWKNKLTRDKHERNLKLETIREWEVMFYINIYLL